MIVSEEMVDSKSSVEETTQAMMSHVDSQEEGNNRRNSPPFMPISHQHSPKNYVRASSVKKIQGLTFNQSQDSKMLTPINGGARIKEILTLGQSKASAAQQIINNAR